MTSVEYDFLTWTSFPSSLKMVNDKPDRFLYSGYLVVGVPVTPSKTLKVNVNVKQESVMNPKFPSGVSVTLWDGAKWRVVRYFWIPLGTYDWHPFTDSYTIPDWAKAMRCTLLAGVKGITWFDDLKIYMDGKLIYDNYFTALRPGKVIPVKWTPPERIIGAWQRFKTGEPMVLFKPPRFLSRI